tara:strand:- start:38 stop:403 length:366 start_codon:yes stop_codon:yes gene_type:complete
MHNDTKNPHFHVVIFNRADDGKHLKFSKGDLFILRQEFVKHSNAVGLKRVATLKQDTPSIMKRLESNIETLSTKPTDFQYKLSKTNKSDFDAFSFRANVFKGIERLFKSLDYSNSNLKRLA